jgi:hypothetical protein
MPFRPLKSISAGEVQEILLSEEDYLAYQAGVHLSLADSSDAASLSRIDAGGNLVGTFSNTIFDEGAVAEPITASTTANITISFGPSIIRLRHTPGLGYGSGAYAEV